MSTQAVRVSDQGDGWPLQVAAVTGALETTPVRVDGVSDQSLLRVRLDEAALGADGARWAALLVLHVQAGRTVGPVGWGIPVYFLEEYPGADEPVPWAAWPACRARVEAVEG